jgi:acetyltransferase
MSRLSGTGDGGDVAGLPAEAPESGGAGDVPGIGAPAPRPAPPPYPSRYSALYRLKDGTEVTVRPILPEDAPLIIAMHARHSEHTIRMRFFGMVKTLSHDSLVRLCHLDYDCAMALVAVRYDTSGARILGVSRYSLDPGTGSAEFALVVGDEHQRRGLGRHLMERLIAVARERGVQRLEGLVLRENTPMLDLMRSLGFGPPTGAPTDEAVQVTMDLAK